jgi:hypothetical protein
MLVLRLRATVYTDLANPSCVVRPVFFLGQGNHAEAAFAPAECFARLASKCC